MSFSQSAPYTSAGISTQPTGNIYANIGPNMPVQGIQIISKPVCTTRILVLSGFAAELKTRDLLSVFAEWEDQAGGYRIKWIDDRSAYIVFQDATVAKKAFLATLANPPPCLAGTATQPAASILPYTGPEVESVLATTANRPRSRSNAQGVAPNGHGRKGSTSSVSGPTIGGVPVSTLMNAGGNLGHARRESSGQNSRSSFVNGPPPSISNDLSTSMHSRNGSLANGLYSRNNEEAII